MPAPVYTNTRMTRAMSRQTESHDQTKVTILTSHFQTVLKKVVSQSHMLSVWIESVERACEAVSEGVGEVLG